MLHILRDHDLGGAVVPALNEIAIADKVEGATIEVLDGALDGILPALPQPPLVEVVSDADDVARVGLATIGPKAHR
jgi:hypothetical protein